jgi:hypothetical protein
VAAEHGVADGEDAGADDRAAAGEDEAPGTRDPGAGADDEIQARVRADIERYGWHVALIPPEAETPGWAATIGLFARTGHPEILLFGPQLDVLTQLANALGAEVLAGRVFEDRERATDILAGGAPLAFRRVRRKWYPPFLGNVAWFYRHEDFPTLQCFWPDRAGHFPWEPECDPAARPEQPLLHEHETHRALSEPLTAVLQREGALPGA